MKEERSGTKREIRKNFQKKREKGLTELCKTS